MEDALAALEQLQISLKHMHKHCDVCADEDPRTGLAMVKGGLELAQQHTQRAICVMQGSTPWRIRALQQAEDFLINLEHPSPLLLLKDTPRVAPTPVAASPLGPLLLDTMMEVGNDATPRCPVGSALGTKRRAEQPGSPGAPKRVARDDRPSPVGAVCALPRALTLPSKEVRRSGARGHAQPATDPVHGRRYQRVALPCRRVCGLDHQALLPGGITTHRARVCSPLPLPAHAHNPAARVVQYVVGESPGHPLSPNTGLTMPLAYVENTSHFLITQFECCARALARDPCAEVDMVCVSKPQEATVATAEATRVLPFVPIGPWGSGWGHVLDNKGLLRRDDGRRMRARSVKRQWCTSPDETLLETRLPPESIVFVVLNSSSSGALQQTV